MEKKRNKKSFLDLSYFCIDNFFCSRDCKGAPKASCETKWSNEGENRNPEKPDLPLGRDCP